MINEHSFKALLPSLGFTADASGNIFSKRFSDAADSLLACEMQADFTKRELVYPEDSGLKVNERQTCNFLAPENFVVFECVHRLLTQGYQPAHIELEHPVTVGHGASGGRLDIWVKDNEGKSLLIIECKTAGKEFEDAWKATQEDGDQLFSYANALDSKTPFVALYASDWNDAEVVHDYRLISLQDNAAFLQSLPKDAPSFQKAATTKERFRAWKETYQRDFTTRGLFESDIAAYTIGKTKYSTRDLKEVDGLEIQKKYHEFATILRQHNVSSHENAFDKLVNLFLAKIVDENSNRDELKFYWKGAAYDDVFSLTDRLQYLYKIGMKEFLGEDVTYIDNNDIERAFRLFKKDATKRIILDYFRQLKFFTNNDFAFIDVHNEKLFHQNAAVLLKIVRMLQDIRLQTEKSHQFLGDLFEGFLDKGVKQSEGQFFTPTPIVRFLVSALPLEKLIADTPKPPRVIDYACGAGHFLNEYCHRIFPFVRRKHGRTPEEGVQIVPDKETFQKYYASVTGIEKEYRLSKVSKVSASMYGQDEIRIIYADALAAHPDVADGSFDVLIANPPYSVKGFLETLSEANRDRYEIFSASDDIARNNSIECFFVERAKQLLAPGGVAAIILPSSILSNTGIYTRMREILLKYFDIVAIAEFGSGTFGKTGTNTATLFLRRKAGKPDLAEHYQNRVEAWFEGDFSKDEEFEDSHLIAAYCVKIGIPLDDYKTLLTGNPDAVLLEAAIFNEYRKTFDASPEVKRIRGKRPSAKYTEAGRAAELEKARLDFLRAIESDKLYYFILAASNPHPVVLVKSPADNKAMKSFLGYEWSSRKGDEGIKYLGAAVSAVDDDEETLSCNKGVAQIETPLFNPADLADSHKINSIIRTAFNGEQAPIPESISEFISRVSIVDMLDFSRVTFDKAFKTTAVASKVSKHLSNKDLTIFKLSNTDEFDISIGRRIVATELEPDGEIPIYSANVFEPFGYSSKLLVTDFSVPSVLWGIDGDWMVNFIPAGKPFYPTDHCGVLRARTDKINPYYLACVLKVEGDNQRFSRTLRASIDRIKSISLGFPAKLEQDRIVAECEKVDAECETARKTIEESKAKIAQAFQGISMQQTQLLEQLLLPVIGGMVKIQENEILKKGRFPVITQEREKLISGYTDNIDAITDLPLIVFGDHSCSFKYVDFPFVRGADGTQLIKTDENVILIKFLCEYLKTISIENAEKYERHFKYLKKIEIPVPPFSEQNRIVAEVEALEAEIATARAILATAPARKRAILEKWL
jgi:type I restriction-modification system DNA methylase subunit/restriction endonuclease S subunit